MRAIRNGEYRNQEHGTISFSRVASGESCAYSGALSLEPDAVSNGDAKTWERLTRAAILGPFPEALHGAKENSQEL